MRRPRFTTAKLMQLSDYSLERPDLISMLRYKKKALHKQCFFTMLSVKGNRQHRRLTASQYTTRFIVALLPVWLVHTGDRHTTAGGRVDKLVVTNIDADMTAGRTRPEQH